MRWALAIVLALAGCSGAGVRASHQAASFQGAFPFQRHPAVAELPVIAHLRGGKTEIFVRGRLSPRTAQEAARQARWTYVDVNLRFVSGEPDASRPAVDLCLFETSRDYAAFVEQVFGAGSELPQSGFYMGSHRLAVADIARGMGNVRHELVHPLLGDDFPEIPPWVNEGIASLYGSARAEGTGVEFLLNHRLRHLHREMRRGRLPSLERLASSGYDDVHGARTATYYALARYLLLYLDERGELERFYHVLRRAPPSAERQLALLRHHVEYREFLSWARSLGPRRPGPTARR
jgi:hypothetical protein